MKRDFRAVIKQDKGWWIGWVEEIPGVNSQGKTRAELLKNLKSAIKEALEFNRAATTPWSPCFGFAGARGELAWQRFRS